MELLTKNWDELVSFLDHYLVTIKYNALKHYQDFLNPSDSNHISYPPDWPVPGMFIYVNGFFASNQDNVHEYFDFFTHLTALETNILNEVRTNIECSDFKSLTLHSKKTKELLLQKSTEIRKQKFSTKYSINPINVYLPEYSFEIISILNEADKNELNEFDYIERISDIFSWLKVYLVNLHVSIKKLFDEVEIHHLKGKPVSIKSFELTHPDKDFGKISILFDSLKRGRKIAKETRLESFRLVFSAIKKRNKVLWSGGYGDLYTLIKTLMDHGHIKKVGKGKWKLVISCFKKYDEQTGIESEIKQNQLQFAKETSDKQLIIDLVRKAFC